MSPLSDVPYQIELTCDGLIALLWQKEATDKSPKTEKVMFLYWT